MRRDVVFQTRILTHYRVPFHEAVKLRLAANGVNYRLLVGRPTVEEAAKGDAGSLPWQENIRSTYVGDSRAVYLSLPKLYNNDLLIIGQENTILSNYVVQILRPFGGARLAFFGHGRNFQSKSADGVAEAFKRFWATKVDWWFAYTEESARVVERAGFDAEKITVFNNSIDTKRVEFDIQSVDKSEVESLRRDLVLGSRNVGIYIGGMYDLKRIPFILKAAEIVRKRIPDFHLVFIGSGVDYGLVEQAARASTWIHALGPKFGREKAVIASLANVMLMPGLIGLGVLDAFAYSTPIITTAVPFHSPEVAYLRDGYNGVVVADSESLDTYADSVCDVLNDDLKRKALQQGGEASLKEYSIENMADRFVGGVMRALEQVR
jgi:glycosyltransferase involved in cell wall biosynthesis